MQHITKSRSKVTSLSSPPVKSGTKRKLEDEASNNYQEEKKVKANKSIKDPCNNKDNNKVNKVIKDPCTDKDKETTVDNKFILSEDDDYVTWASVVYCPPDSDDGKSEVECAVQIGRCKKKPVPSNNEAYLTQARHLTFNLSSDSDKIVCLSQKDHLALAKLQPQLEERRNLIKKEISTCKFHIKMTSGSYFFCKNMVGDGGNGKVFKAFDPEKLSYIALKFQPPGPFVEIELEVLKSMQGSKHFPCYYGEKMYKEKGGKLWSVLCLELLGKDLAEFQKVPQKGSVVFALALQCVPPIRELHNAGYIHRDIKPANFVLGVDGENRNVFRLIDFGHAKKYKDEEGNIIPPSGLSYYVGTPRYSSPLSHNPRYHQSRKDDFISLAFSTIEIYNGVALPWAVHDKNPVEAGAAKINCNINAMIEHMPGAFENFFTHICSLKFADEPDYDYISRCLKDAAKECIVKENDPNFNLENFLNEGIDFFHCVNAV